MKSSGKPSEFQVDPRVRKILADWGQSRGSELGLLELRRNGQKLPAEQREQLILRLAEISLGLLFVVQERDRPA